MKVVCLVSGGIDSPVAAAMLVVTIAALRSGCDGIGSWWFPIFNSKACR